MPQPTTPSLDRRSLIKNLAGAAMSVGAARAFPAWATSGTGGAAAKGAVLSGDLIQLNVAQGHFGVGGKSRHAISVNGSVPAPLIRLKEGQNVRIAVTNHLREDTSIHWHGLLVPFQMDGVPGVSFPGIGPGETFTYEFPVRQAGSYWYHSHSGMQEAMGLYGPIIIDPAADDPVSHDREHVIVLADWSPVHPHMLLKRLKQMGGYYNMQRQTMAGLLAGRDQSLKERIDWGGMRMDPTDISDISAAAYRYLVNGHGPDENWTGLFAPGERVRLRIINASAMTNFNVRLPGLPMTVVQCDGQDVQPVETDEFQIGIAETYDVIVQPEKAAAYALIAEAIDRSGLVRATLAPRPGMVAPIPPLRPRPLLGMKDMGMDMSGMNHGEGHAMRMTMRDPSVAPQVDMGAGVATLSPMPVDRTGERPTGLEEVDHRVLTYADLKSLTPNADHRAPSRSIDIHLTANMERYMWSFDGVKLSDGADPIPFRHGERVRVTLINDTMMPHPIHLHGHFFELEIGQGVHNPRKHTVNVLPGGKVSFHLTADALGDWAFHCHMLMHMHSGMMRVVTVRHAEDGA
ncbi:copper resistance system multicopper oxidase [Sphingobium fontiphilum]